MNKRRNTVIVIMFLSLIGALATGNELLFNLTYLLGLLLIFSFLWAWSNISWVYIARVTQTRRTQVGRPLEERFTVRNTSRIPKLWLELRDFSNLPGHLASKVVYSLSGLDSFSWRVNTLCRERGRYQLGPILLSSSDPFGFFPMERELTATTHVVVYPMTYELHEFALPLGVLPGGDALRRRTHYVTTNASGVREYAPGDSFSRIHWRSVARRGRLIVKDFELDPLADIWVLPDMAAMGHVISAEMHAEIRRQQREGNTIPIWMRLTKEEFRLPEATEEYTVAAAASLAHHFLRRDRAVGMLAYGQSKELVQPDRGERQRTRILETLAVLRAVGSLPLADIVHAESHLFPRGTTILAITPTTSSTWVAAVQQLTRRGLRVVTILIDPESFGGRQSAKPLATLLQANGLSYHLLQQGDDLAAILSTGYSSPLIHRA
jgi:uncharacterized protein (DUF58 family)